MFSACLWLTAHVRTEKSQLTNSISKGKESCGFFNFAEFIFHPVVSLTI
jgi:hypothetical protein